MEKKFSNPSTKASTFKFIELPTENLSLMEIDSLIVIILKMWVDNNDYAVSLGSNDEYELDSWTHNNQLYVPFPFQVDDSLNSLTQSIQPCTNVSIVIKIFIESSKVDYAYIASSQNGFVLPDSTIAVNLSKCTKALCFLCKGKKASHGSFYEDE